MKMNNIILIFTKIDHILFLHAYYLLKNLYNKHSAYLMKILWETLYNPMANDLDIARLILLTY